MVSEVVPLPRTCKLRCSSTRCVRASLNVARVVCVFLWSYRHRPSGKTHIVVCLKVRHDAGFDTYPPGAFECCFVLI